MYSFNAMYEAEAYRHERLNDACCYRRNKLPAQSIRPFVILASLLVSTLMASWYRPMK